MMPDMDQIGRIFHVDSPQHWRKYRDTPTVHILRQYEVDSFLCTLSYHELLGFIPEEPGSDTQIFVIREANAFRMLCEDPNAFLDDGEE
jgi:hypothetical protein